MSPKIPVLLLLLWVAACTGRPAIPVQGMWHGTVELPDGVSVPLQMTLDFSGSKPVGFFLVGDEKNPIPEISKAGDTVTLGFSEYSAEIRAMWNGSQLKGQYSRIRSDGTKSMPFTASPDAATSNHSGSQLPVSRIDGNYRVSFQGEGKVDDTTVAKFWNKDGRILGTFIAPDGDYGLLVGESSGATQLQLSRFTGWQAIAIVLQPGGETWSGQFYAASNARPQPFVLQPQPDLKVEVPAAKHTSMKNPEAEFTFSGTSLSGETVRNTDERFKGKALLVDFMGTWCHNCLDEAPVLQQLQNRFGKDGFEVVGLSFEINDDAALAKKNLQLYKDRFGLTYTLLFCGSLDDENVKKQIHSQLDNFFAFPTAIFIGKDRKVRTIHSGFKGPGTGEEFQSQIREFEELAGKLVAR